MTAVAYAFAGRNVDVSDIRNVSSPLTSSYLQVFHTGFACRSIMAKAGPAAQVIIMEDIADVTPMNLLAALHHDEPQRDIYLFVQEHSAALASKVRAAGGRGIIDKKQLDCMVGSPRLLIAAEPVVQPALVPPTDDTPSGAYAGCLAYGNPNDTAPRQHTASEVPREQANDTASPPAPALRPISAAMPSAVDAPRRSGVQDAPRIASLIEQSSKGSAIAFVSGRGGVGKSTLSLLSALVLQEQGFKVVALDLDMQFGDLAYLAEHVAPERMQRLEFEAALSNSQRMHLSPNRLCLITAPKRPEQAEDRIEEVSDFVKSLKHLADYVVINTGSFWSELQAVLAQSVDRLVFLMDQRATSVRACQQIANLCIRLQIPSLRFIYALNRYTRNASLTDLDVSLTLGGCEVVTIAEGGPLVDEMLSLGTPVELLKTETGLRASLEALLAACSASDTPLVHQHVRPAKTTLSNIFTQRKKGKGNVTS
jgi:MinD-like ATPase involved in chromosome partitioning or flagellar assembly